MTCYVDTSVWIALLAKEKTAPSVAAWMARGTPLLTAEWTQVEVASGLGIKARRLEFNQAVASQMCAAFRQLIAMDGVAIAPIVPTDFEEAALICEQVDLAIRGGDGLHLAVAQRVGAAHFFSFDNALKRQAKRMGMELMEP